VEGPTNAGEVSSATIVEHPCFFQLALLRIDKIGPIHFRQLRQYFGSEKSVFEADYHELTEIGLSSKALRQVSEIKQLINSGKSKNFPADNIVQGVMRDIRWLSHPQHHVIGQESGLFPRLLKQIHGCPPLLFVIGDPQILSSPQLAIVGAVVRHEPVVRMPGSLQVNLSLRGWSLPVAWQAA
jgi:DNA processing protein